MIALHKHAHTYPKVHNVSVVHVWWLEHTYILSTDDGGVQKEMKRIFFFFFYTAFIKVVFILSLAVSLSSPREAEVM